MAENKEPKAEAKDAPHLVNMDLGDIVSMINRRAKEFALAEDKAVELASEMPEKEFFNLFFALEFVFKTEQGQLSVGDIESENDALYLYAVLVEEMTKRTGLKYNIEDNYII
jgi:hypothetical protein